MSKVFLFSADRQVDLKRRQAAKELIVSLFKHERYKLKRVNYIFCSDEYLLPVNIEFMKHFTLTDVITFSFSREAEPVEGEVYLSVDRIKENAKSFNSTYQNELLRVMIHGALHLCGYTDKTKAAKARMREKENYYITKLSST
jgi:rRNA maturation RNase YbeY